MAVAVVLTSFRRPGNLPDLLARALAARSVGPVYLIDNAPGRESARAVARAARRCPGQVVHLPQSTNRGPTLRFALAAGLDADRVIVIDDDIFLTPAQIDALAARLAAEPARMHGIWGQRIELGAPGEPPRLGPSGWGEVRRADVLNRVYAFTPAYAARAIAEAARLGWHPWEWSRIGPVEDVLLSLLAPLRVRVHFLGPFASCATSDTPGIALWKRPDFAARRSEAVARILSTGGRRSLSGARLP